MDLSIIIPCYNVEKYILNCLESVKNLDGITYEIIAINDGSTDNTLRYLTEFRDNYSGEIKIIEQENKGQSSARNVGLSFAKGEYVFFLDGDDYVYGEELIHFVKKVREDDLDIGFADYLKCINSELIRVNTSVERLRRLENNNDICSGVEYAEKTFDKKRNYINTEVCFALYKRSFVCDNNLCFKEGMYHEDTLFFYQSIVLANKVRFYDICFYVYIIHQGSTMTSDSTSVKRKQAKLYIANELLRIKQQQKLSVYFIDSYIVNLYYYVANILKTQNIKSIDICECTKLSLKSRIMYILLWMRGLT